MASALTTTLTVTQTVKENRNTTNAVTHTNPNVSVTRTGDNVDHRILTVDSTEDTFTISTEIGNAGWCYIKNHDDPAGTNIDLTVGYVTESDADGGGAGTAQFASHGIRIKAGESACFRLVETVSALYMKSDSASVLVEVKVWED